MIARTGRMIGMAVTTGIVVMIDAVETAETTEAVGTIVAVEIADQTETTAMSDIQTTDKIEGVSAQTHRARHRAIQHLTHLDEVDSTNAVNGQA